jgi:hypothetical protein
MKPLRPNRAARVEQDVGPVAPGVVHYTGDLLFNDLWLRPALAPRHRGLVTGRRCRRLSAAGAAHHDSSIHNRHAGRDVWAPRQSYLLDRHHRATARDQ